MLKNNLDQSSSLYLQQHAHHPVYWQLWDEKILALAEKLNRPILLSIGYSACHWCHVMAHETFENQQIADFLNAHFIAIKIDREEYPAIDMIYQRALGFLGIQGGWPLTIFITADGKPFWGGTYFPLEDRYGRPGFIKILHAIHDAWQHKYQDLIDGANQLTSAIQKIDLLKMNQGDFLTKNQIRAMAAKLSDYLDRDYGGIGGAPKFPQTQQFEFMERYASETLNDAVPYQDIFDWLDMSLDNICLGGLFDHLGGGFCRYATDNIWLVPHFEKMLYDNALLINLLQYYHCEKPLYQYCITETIHWLIREMQDENGGFYSALDADSEGVEGKFYLWQINEIESLLHDDAQAFIEFYHLTPEGNFEGNNILNRLGEKQIPEKPADNGADFAQSRQILFQARNQRIPPGRDEKILTDWNALMIISLTQAATIYQNDAWLKAAMKAFDFITENMQQDENQLYHCFAGGKAYIAGFLDDYANMIMAALTLYNVTGEERLLQKAALWSNYVHAHFRHESGAYHFSNDRIGKLISHPITAMDNPTPSGNAMLAKGFFRLALATGDYRLIEYADGIFSAFKEKLSEDFPSMCGLLNAYLSNQSVFCFALNGNKEEMILTRKMILEAKLPDFMIIDYKNIQENSSLYGYTPKMDVSQQQHNKNAFQVVICQNQQCQPPITSFDRFSDFLYRLKKR